MGKYSIVLYTVEENEIGIFDIGAGCETRVRELEAMVKFDVCFVVVETVL